LEKISTAVAASARTSAIEPVHSRKRARSWQAAASAVNEPIHLASSWVRPST
jgi:hypothetical protein